MIKNRGIILVVLIVFGGLVSASVTRAFFSDSSTSQNNTFSAKEFFPKNAPLYVSNSFTCTAGATDTSNQKGTVIFDRNGGSLDISVEVNGATPNTSYQLWVNQDPGACPLGAPTVSSFLTTDGSGNGSANLPGHAIVGGATNFWVSIVGGSDVLRSTSVQF